MLPTTIVQGMHVIVNERADNWRECTYDVRVRQIIDADGGRHDTLTIPPRGVVHVLSEELLRMPHDLAGVALVKTDLCNRGLLPLNIGVVDPGFQGPVSTAILNFGAHDAQLSKDEPFLRLCFYKLSPAPPQMRAAQVLTHDSAVDKITARALRNFSRDFLDVTNLTTAVALEQTRHLRRNMVEVIAVLGIVFALLGVIVPIIINYSSFHMAKDWAAPRGVDPVDRRELEALQLKAEAERNELQRQIDDLKKKKPGH